jgi:hypothetical protein
MVTESLCITQIRRVDICREKIRFASMEAADRNHIVPLDVPECLNVESEVAGCGSIREGPDGGQLLPQCRIWLCRECSDGGEVALQESASSQDSDRAISHRIGP